MSLKFTINDKCTSCMACVRVCPVDAIAVTDDNVRIVEDSCIACGLCVPSCNHDSIDVVGDLVQCLQVLDTRDAVLILPTEACVYFFPAVPEQVMNACFAAGFRDVYFESLGDELVALEYLKIWRAGRNHGVVRSTNSIMVDYCRLRLPELLPFLAPVVTPAVALARFIGKTAKQPATLVYAGLSSPTTTGTADEIDCYLSFEELETVLAARGALPSEQSLTLQRVPPERRRHVSLAGGLPRAMLESESASSQRFSKQRGLGSLKSVARALLDNETTFGFVDALPFEGNLAHPAFGPEEDLFWRKSVAALAEPPLADQPVVEAVDIDLSAFFEPAEEDGQIPDATAIEQVLDRIGTTPDGNAWDCGACGRPTCSGFARAVVRGRASMSLCPIYLNRQFERAAEDAAYDSLTRIYSYRILESRLEEEMARANREGSSLAILFADLDDFKPVNDEHGHAVGNLVLQEVARILRETTRASDIACRYGGDEFVVILVNPDLEGAEQVAEQIRHRVEQLKVRTASGETGVTLSIGLAYHSGTERSSITSDVLMSEADAALYVAKAQGGNTVHTAVGGELVK